MCGVAAIFAYGEAAPPIDRAEILRMRDRMTSRGPDGEGEWFSEKSQVGLGHRRLSIIDLSPAGAQPMFNADRSLVIIFNGEIYNYEELRSRLSAKGYRFRSNSDTEVLLALYETRGGEAMLNDLRGMYAFAIWDQPRQCLFLARDPFGIKPLYYSDNGHTFRVASQVKALCAGGAIDLSPDPAGHVGFFLWGHVPDPYTMFRNIRALPAGHSMRVGRSGPRAPQEFCSISKILAGAEASSSEIGARVAGEASSSKLAAREGNSELLTSNSELLRTALAESVRYHLVADVAVGVFLSSGLDSTMITALAAEQGGDLRTVTLGFEEYKGTPADEVPLAEEFAKCCGAKHQTIWISREIFEAERKHLFDAMDRPSIDGVNTFFVSLAAKRAGLKVALSGLGGDELFAGYPSFREIPRSVQFLKAFSSWRALGSGVRVLSAPILKRLTSPKYAGLFEYGGSYSGAYLLRRGMFMPWELPGLLDPDFVREGWRELQTLVRLDETLDDIKSPRLKISALEMNWYMRNQLLIDSDWAGMAHSVEIRVPFVDVDLLRQLAPLFAIQPELTKREIARACIAGEPRSSKLEARLFDRAKTGFTVPVREWLLADASSSKLGARSSDDKNSQLKQARAKRSLNFQLAARMRGLRGWAREVYAQYASGERGAGSREQGAGGREQSAKSEAQSAKHQATLSPLPLALGAGTSAAAKLRIMFLLTDGFGGFGGIAKFNRDFLSALSSSDDVTEILALPRLMPETTGIVPAKVTYSTAGLGGKLRYFLATLNAARRLAVPPGGTAQSAKSEAQRARKGQQDYETTGQQDEGPVVSSQNLTASSQSSSSELLAPARSSASRSADGLRPIVICGHINLLPAAAAARWLTGGELYLIIHGIDAWQPTRDPIANFCVRYIDDFIAVSALTRRRFLRWSGVRQDHGIILLDSVDLSEFKPGPKSEELVRRYNLEGRPTLMTLGRLDSRERYKGIDEVIEALPEIGKAIPGVTYMVVGDGDDRPRLENKARSLGLEVDAEHGSRERGAASMEQGAKQGAGSREQGAGGRGQSAKSEAQSGESREQSAKNRTSNFEFLAPARSAASREGPVVSSQQGAPERGESGWSGGQNPTDSSTPRVVFAGRVGENMKADYFRLADVFVLAGWGEGFGIVLLEAMACGVPVIGSKLDATREALRDGKLGRLVNPKNQSELTEAIIAALNSPADRSRSVPGVEYFSSEQFEQRVHAILRSIRGDGAKARSRELGARSEA
jgi:asparagine synthase (glutamine-hydrolysing)